MGYVYLFLEIETGGLESHKIGITKNDPKFRIKQLQTGNSRKITLLRSYLTDNHLKVEQWLHRKYGNQKTQSNNEWRGLTDEQVFSFLNDCKEADENIKFLLNNNHFYN